jgi:hypothetical protein
VCTSMRPCGYLITPGEFCRYTGNNRTIELLRFYVLKLRQIVCRCVCVVWWRAHLGSWLEVGGECCDLVVDEFAPGETLGDCRGVLAIEGAVLMSEEDPHRLPTGVVG